MAKQNKVAVNLAQDFTDAEKAQARSNIGALGSADVLTANRYNWSSPSVPTSVEEIKFNQKGVSTAQIMADSTDLGSTVPLPSLNADEGKVPVAYYRDGRGYYLLEKYKDSRLPDSSSSDNGKALIVDSSGNPIWSTIDVAPTISRISEYATNDSPSMIGTTYGADHKRALHLFTEGTYPNTISAWIQEKDYKYGILHYTMALELWNSDTVTKWCVIDQGHIQNIDFHIIGKGLYIPFAPGHTYVPVDHTVVFLKSDVGNILSTISVVMGLQTWPVGDPNFHADDMFQVSTIHSNLTLFKW